MIEIVTCANRQQAEELLRTGEDETVIVIVPPRHFRMTMYHVVCPTWAAAVEFSSWISAQEDVKWMDISNHQNIVPSGLLVFTVLPKDKKTFPHPSDWMKD